MGADTVGGEGVAAGGGVVEAGLVLELSEAGADMGSGICAFIPTVELAEPAPPPPQPAHSTTHTIPDANRIDPMTPPRPRYVSAARSGNVQSSRKRSLPRAGSGNFWGHCTVHVGECFLPSD